jgi:cobalt-zinc-cadmium efflux system outer membrane protein
MRPIVVCFIAAASCSSPAVTHPADGVSPAPTEAAAVFARPTPDVTSAERLDIGSVTALALRANPALREANDVLDAAGGRADQAGRWMNPRLSVEARDVPRHPLVLDDGGRWVVLSQPLAIGGRLSAARDAAAAERDAVSFDVEAAARKVVADVHRACADLDAADAAETLRIEDERGAADLLAGAQRRAAQATATAAEVTTLEVESERAQMEVRHRGRDRVTAVASLRALLGGAAPRLVHVDWNPDSAPPARAGAALEEPPQFLAAARRVEAARLRLDEARAMRVPDVEVSVAYGRVGAAATEQVEAGITIPLPVFDSNHGRVREAAAQLRAAQAAEERVRSEIGARRRTAAADLAAARADLAAQRDRIVPAAERLAAQIGGAFDQGVRSANDVILARRSLADARLGLVEAQRAVRRADADLFELGASGEEVRR